MSKDLELRLKLTATDKNVAGTVRNTKKEVQGLNDTLGTTSSRARGTASGMSGLTTAGDEATRMFKLQKGSLQQAGYQFQDLAVQIGSGTSAFVAIGQQGSQLLGILGPGGALLGAVVAISSVVGGTLVSAMGDGEKAIDALDAAMDRLNNTAEKSDGITVLTQQIRDLARESEVAARARITSAIQDAQKASEAAARGIGEAFGDLPISDMFGLKDLEDFTESLGTFEAYLQAGYIQDDLKDLGEMFGLSGQRAQAAGRQIGELLTQLRVDPSGDNFRALEDAMGSLLLEGENPSEGITQLIGDLGAYFDSAREAADRTEYLKRIMEDFGIATGDQGAADEVKKMVAALQAEAAAIGETSRQTDIRIAKDLGATETQLSAINAAYSAIEAEEARQEALKKSAEAAREAERAQRDYENSVASLVNELDPLGAQFESVYDKQQLLIQAAQDGLITKDQRDFLIESLVTGLADAGEEGGSELAEKLEAQAARAADRVAISLQTAITSGDWDGVGATVGGALAGAIGGMVTETLMEQMAGQAGASIFGPIVGAVAGGVAGLAVNALSDWLSSSDWDPTEARQASQGTGTVLGDISAKSESIRRAVEGSESGIGQLVGINQGMLQALQTLQMGISGASGMVASGYGNLSMPTNFNRTISGSDFDITNGIMPIIDETLGAAFDFFDGAFDILSFGSFDLGDTLSSVFGGSRKVKDLGVQFFGATLDEMIRGWRDGDRNLTAQAYASIEEDGGMFHSDDRWDEFQRLGPEAENQISLVFQGIRDSVVTGAEALGMADSEINRALSQFRVATQKVSLEDLSAEEQAAELEAVFSSILDDLAGSIVPYLDEFQRAGEGLGETLSRVANQTLVAQEAVTRLGIGFSDLAGRELVVASQRLMEAAGGVEQFITSMQGFIGNFASDAQQFELAQSDITRALGQANLQLPATRDGYYDLLQAQNGATASGAENIATLLRLQGVADEYYTFLEDAQRSTLESQRDFLSAQQSAYRDALREAEAMASSVSRALDGLTVTGQQFTQASRERALDSLDAMARSGTVSSAGELDAALAAATNIRTDEFSTLGDYIRSVARTGETLTAVQRVTDSRVSREERLLGNIKRQLEAMTEELSAVGRASAKNTAKTARILERIEIGGLEVRE